MSAKTANRRPSVSWIFNDSDLLGTIRYMAPEQLRGELLTPACDMYALGLTERLGLEESGGLLRLGMVHYNTSVEIDRLLQALDEL